MATLSPYLNFNGKTAEAMRLYQSLLGGELTMQTFEQAKMARSRAEKDLIIHAKLNGGGFVLMASDTMPSHLAKFGDNVHLSLNSKDGARLTSIFNGLAVGGKVDLPLAKQFWGDTYGQVTDRFGIHWMVNIEAERPSS